MDTNIEAVMPDLQAAKKAVDELTEAFKAASGLEAFTPSLGLALGGLRTAQTGLDGHLQNMAAATSKPPSLPAIKKPA